jgi:hypothetical protein
MKKRIVIAIAVALLLGLGASAGLADSSARPFKGIHSGPWWVLNAPGNPDPVHGECNPTGGQPFCVILMEGKFIGTHFGRGTLEGTHWSDWSGLNPATGCCFTSEDGEFRLVAANGDEVYGIYSGLGQVVEFEPMMILEVEGTYEIEGGTGRFEGATGQFQSSFSGPSTSPEGGEGTSLFSGTIGY